ncbi:MAG: SH3 domain-containing protein [Acutalibacteraceae bacterium]
MKTLKTAIALILVSIMVAACFVGCNKPGGNDPITDPPIDPSTSEVVVTDDSTEPSVEDTSTTKKDNTTEKEDPTTEKPEPTTKEESTTKKPEPTTQKPEPTTQKPEPTTQKPEPTTQKQAKYTEKKETVYATSYVYVRAGAGKSYDIVGHLDKNQSVTRLAKGDNGWSKVSYNGKTRYVSSDALTTTKPVVPTTEKTEPTTQKQEPTTKPPKTELTTEKREEPTTKIVVEDGQEYLIDANGNKWPIDTSDTAGETKHYDANICYVCGKSTCVQSTKPYFCVTCKKTIDAGTCHPRTHYKASH